jgi:serine/threonine protein kinase
MDISRGVRLETYEIVAPIASGGMGEVWLARDVPLNRKAAIKFLPADVTRDEDRVARFRQEARAASALNHPNVCAIYTLGQMDDGRVFIAMEHVEGETLRERLARGRFAVENALDIATQIASALTAAHAAGVIHRDVKPENVILRADGVVKVLDFGLAKLAPSGATAGVETTRTTLQTTAGAVMGTIAYMSPEQARGQEVDARTDIWSLGVVLYELLAGRVPFEGGTISDGLVSILDRAPTPLPQLVPRAPRELQRIVTKALRKDREKRYSSICRRSGTSSTLMGDCRPRMNTRMLRTCQPPCDGTSKSPSPRWPCCSSSSVSEDGGRRALFANEPRTLRSHR